MTENNCRLSEPITPDWNSIDTTSIKESYDEMMCRFFNSVEKAEERIIRAFAEQEGLSLKCAKYLINRQFNFRVKTINPDSMIGQPEFQLVLELKSPEEILRDIDTLPSSNLECDKEFLKKTVDFFSMYELTRIDLPRPSRKYCKKMLCDEDGEYIPIIDGDNGEILQ